MHKLLLITIFSGASFMNAQTFLGLQHSNFGGIHQAGLNPAAMSGSRYKMYFNGFTSGFSFNNDYLKINFPFSFLNLISGNVPAQYQNANGGIDFNDDWLQENVNGKAKNVNLSLQTRVPGFMIKIKNDWAFGFQYRNTISIQVNDVAESLARLARYGIDSSSGSVSYSGPNRFQIGETFGDNAFTVNMNAYGELAFPISKTIISKDKFKIMAGLTPKMLLGYGTAYIKNRGMQIKASGTDTITFGQTDLEYGYTNPEVFTGLKGVNLNFLDGGIQGTGFGYDLGASFEYYGDKKAADEKNGKYLFRGGMSLLDGGNIRYKSSMKNTRMFNQSGTDRYLVIVPEMADAWSKGQNEGLAYADSLIRTVFDVDTTARTVATRMPASLNLQFDWNVYKKLFLGLNWNQDLRGKKVIGVRRPSYLVLMPRFETRVFELSVPVGIMNDYKNTRLGIYLRVGPVFIGSDNLIGQLKGNNVYGLDLYFGASFGIASKKDKDKSGDTKGGNISY